MAISGGTIARPGTSEPEGVVAARSPPSRAGIQSRRGADELPEMNWLKRELSCCGHIEVVLVPRALAAIWRSRPRWRRWRRRSSRTDNAWVEAGVPTEYD